MSVYLGNQKVSITRNVGEGGLDPETMAELNDAVGWRTGKYDERTVAQMVEELNKQYMVDIDINYHCGQDTYESWTRPQDWPDLDSLNLSMEDGTPDYIYMTYDATSDLAAVALHIEMVSGETPISCTIGHITNGEYIVDNTITGTSNNYVYWFNNYPYDYPVIRVLGSIKYCYTYNITDADGRIQNFRKQPIVERIAYVPHLIRLCPGSSNAWTTYTLEREKIGNGEGTALTNLYYAWAYGRRLRVLDISNLKTPNNTNLDGAFYYCCSLTGTLDLRHFDVSKVTAISNTFALGTYLETIDLRGWQTNALTTLTSAFAYCRALREIKGIENFNTSKCTTFASMFIECYCLQELDLHLWDTSKVTTLSSTFNSCYAIKNLNISTWDVSNVTNLGSTFSGCWELRKLDIENWTPVKVTNMGSTFSNCRNLKILNLSNWAVGALTTIGSCFNNCYSLQKLDISKLIIPSTCTSIYCCFYNCWSLKELNFNTNCDVSGLGNGNNTANSMFTSCYSLKKITGIKNWQFNLSNGLNSFFANCYSLEELDISGWKVNTITSFSAMFDYCYSLKELDVSQWNVQSATNLSGMFRSCYHLAEIDVSSWDISNCTTLANMFNNCRSLVSVGDLSDWDTSNVTSLADMFYGCTSLKEVKGLSNWNVSKVTSIAELFYQARALKEVAIEDWNLAACTSMNSVFREMYNLEHLSLKNWSIPKITAAPTYFCNGDVNLRQIDYTLPIAYSHSYNGCENLSHESIMTIINTLPTVSTTRTLNLTTLNIQSLSAAEKAIATNKGWTLAN